MVTLVVWNLPFMYPVLFTQWLSYGAIFSEEWKFTFFRTMFYRAMSSSALIMINLVFWTKSMAAIASKNLQVSMIRVEGKGFQNKCFYFQYNFSSIWKYHPKNIIQIVKMESPLSWWVYDLIAHIFYKTESIDKLEHVMWY